MSFEHLPRDQQAQYIRMKLARIEELEADVSDLPSTRQNQETLRDLANARREYTKALERLEHPSLWQRTNRWVNNWAEQDRAREEARKQRKGCVRCGGSGRVVGAGEWFETCGSCQGTGRRS